MHTTFSLSFDISLSVDRHSSWIHLFFSSFHKGKSSHNLKWAILPTSSHIGCIWRARLSVLPESTDFWYVSPIMSYETNWIGYVRKKKLQIDPKGRDDSWQQLGAQWKKIRPKGRYTFNMIKLRWAYFQRSREVAACSAPLLLPAKTGGKHAKSGARKSDIILEDKVSFRSRMIL